MCQKKRAPFIDRRSSFTSTNHVCKLSLFVHLCHSLPTRAHINTYSKIIGPMLSAPSHHSYLNHRMSHISTILYMQLSYHYELRRHHRRNYRYNCFKTYNPSPTSTCNSFNRQLNIIVSTTHTGSTLRTTPSYLLTT